MVRDGRRVQLVEAALHCDGAEVCRGTGLRMRVAEALELPAGDGTLPPRPGPSRPGCRATGRGGAVSSRPASSCASSAARCDPRDRPRSGVRLLGTVVEGEPPSPLMRVAAAADFGNGISSLLPWEGWLFINPELTVYTHRPPRGEWVCLDARSELNPAGVGAAHSVISDVDGSIGYALQALLVDRR